MQRRIVTIPLGLAERFRHQPPRPEPPPPRAVFTSNPARDLDWLLRVWCERIRPHVPAAELLLFSGPQVYQMRPGSGLDLMNSVLAKAASLGAHGVRPQRPLTRQALARQVAQARAMLYRGHEEETFCLALAEAQALGVPCVVQAIGSTPERVRDGLTGHLARDEAGFAEHAIRLLTDDAAWAAMHRNALRLQAGRSWDDAARDFEGLMGA
jgi:glycosyltransferase involved in cell wall biosynthesis